MPYMPSIPVRNAMSSVLPRHMCERVVTATGLVTSLSALLSLVSCGIGLSSSPDFFGVWLGLALGGRKAHTSGFFLLSLLGKNVHQVFVSSLLLVFVPI